jgi:alpha-D-ribose 1-methylphosphonate 5-triphosphate synthase subunit PhnG
MPPKRMKVDSAQFREGDRINLGDIYVIRTAVRLRGGTVKATALNTRTKRIARITFAANTDWYVQRDISW